MASTLRFATYAVPVIGALIVSPLLSGTAFAATPAAQAASHQLSAAVSAPADNNSGGLGSVCVGDGRCDGGKTRQPHRLGTPGGAAPSAAIGTVAW
jgi:hypothetical protein